MLLLFWKTGKFFYFKNLPVMLAGAAAICSGVPAATICPPSVPPPGPMSMM